MNLDYQLAQELKDAGFPMHRIEPGMSIGRWPTLDMNPSGDQEIGAQHFYTPTLEELIEACGNFRSLGKERGENGRWVADTVGGFLEGSLGFGATPTEAVTRLWLALNKKS